MRKKWGEPKKNFGFHFGAAIGVVAREMGQNGSKLGEPKIYFVSLLGLPREPKKNFGSLYFSIFDLTCACLIEIILFNSK